MLNLFSSQFTGNTAFALYLLIPSGYVM